LIGSDKKEKHEIGIVHHPSHKGKERGRSGEPNQRSGVFTQGRKEGLASLSFHAREKKGTASFGTDPERKRGEY